jgi:single-strand DNA-binding protein
MDIAKALLIGRLTRDPEIRYTAKGTAVTTLRLAVNHRAREKKETSFFDVVAFGPLAETCGEYLAKGRAVLVDGRLRERSWEAPDGTRRSRIEVLAASVEFLDAPPDTGKGGRPEKDASPGEAASGAPREDEEPPF